MTEQAPSPALNWTELDTKAVNTAKALAADAVQNAGNGHPGTAISLAPLAHLLFQKVMRHDPSDPLWAGRDRFVLSAGHSSLTLYNQLFLSGYGLELADIQALRTWGSATPGHPEYGHTDGVEITTGPLGQGLASAVGMAMAARRERGLFDPDTPAGQSPFDHRVFVVAGDGCLQEGVTSEASSLAGTQKLGNLIVIWDDNQISIEDDTIIAFSEDVLARYEAYGWHTQHVDWRTAGADGSYKEDVAALYDALMAACAQTSRPSIIRLSTIIAWPCPTKANTGASHGAALGEEEIAGLKTALSMDPSVNFAVHDDVLAYTRDNAAKRAAAERVTWDSQLQQWAAANPERATLRTRLAAQQLPAGFADALPTFAPGQAMATRAASGKVLNALAPIMPELWGGSADLAGSNNTTMAGEPSFLPECRQSQMFPGNEYGRTLHFGIREHAMGAILNGIALDGLTRPYGGTFFVFADYMRPSVRLAALMQVPAIYVWTHDSIGVGEDGPTHQPIEHLWSYRAIPGLDVVRPADANEVSAAWATTLSLHDRPVALVLSRQNLPVPARHEGEATGEETADLVASTDGVARGAYVLAEAPAARSERHANPDATPAIDVILIATGSEVALALAARDQLAERGIAARVVSAPCLEWFAEQGSNYRDEILPPQVRARVSVEAGSTFGWASYLGDAGRSVGINHFGASADGARLFKEFGFTTEAVVAAAEESIAAARQVADPNTPAAANQAQTYGGPAQ